MHNNSTVLPKKPLYIYIEGGKGGGGGGGGGMDHVSQ
jgi:hypothetical protein